MANSDVDKANLLNSFFCSCFNRSHPPIQHQPTPDIDSSTCPEELLCTDSEVYEMLAALDVTKSSGPDGISPRMLKSTAPCIAPSLTRLFNRSVHFSWNHSVILEKICSSSNTKMPTAFQSMQLSSCLSPSHCQQDSRTSHLHANY